MESKEIQKLIDFIAHSGLDEVAIETSDLKIAVKRYGAGVAVAPVVVQHQAPAPVAAAPAVAPVAAAIPTPVAATPVASNLITIKAPMIGTLYRRSKPDQPPFIEVGSEIKVGQVLCVIEAMKLFNEIESEVAGRVVQVMVDDKSPVEYDQALFVVEPL